MNAEALVGKRLGSYTLRRVIGVGSMGAVYLARQSQTRQQYILKVFLHASSLEPLQYIDFLLRFRQEMEPVSSLQHPHILPILEYEERDGFVYLVMPSIHVRNLESVLNSQKILSLSKIANYLDQLADALDYAHEQGVLHLDIKPSNILVTLDDDTLLLSDFALTKAMTERQAARIRQFKVGMLDYMSPEQVIGKDPTERSDLYSLGAVLYHMVTGSTPFQGKTMIELAKKHVQEAPQSPRTKRTDLPLTAEQVILRAMTKRPAHRYAKAQELALAFRLTLETASTELAQPQNDAILSSFASSSEAYPAYSLFDPQWRTELNSVKDSQSALGSSTSTLAAAATTPTGALVSALNLEHSSQPETMPEKSSHSLRVVHFNPITPVQDSPIFADRSTHPANILAAMPVQDTWLDLAQNANSISNMTGSNTAVPVQNARAFPEQSTYPGGVMTVPDSEQVTTGKIVKLTSPAKVVNVPVAGQPGRYLVGLLPVPEVVQSERSEQTSTQHTAEYLKKNSKIIGLALLVIFLLGTGTLWFAHQRASSNTVVVTVVTTPDLKATTGAQATATAEANIILYDPMTTNIHNWPLMASGSMQYVFKENAYHITDNDNNRGAPAILSGLILQDPFAYTLTMEEIKGDDTSVNNEFGMIFRATIQSKGGKTFTSFYTLEVLNKSGGEYQFWKYDDSQGPKSNLWVKLASHSFGNEFHIGQGPKNINTFKLLANGKNFTLIVNGKKAWTFQDGSFASGGVGMLVNLKGTEVAFSNLLLTHT